MDSDAVVALLGAAVLAFLVRFFNVVLAWLARVLGVNAPEPIPTGTHGAKSPGLPPTTPVEARSDASAPDGPEIDTGGPTT